MDCKEIGRVTQVAPVPEAPPRSLDEAMRERAAETAGKSHPDDKDRDQDKEREAGHGMALLTLPLWRDAFTRLALQIGRGGPSGLASRVAVKPAMQEEGASDGKAGPHVRATNAPKAGAKATAGLHALHDARDALAQVRSKSAEQATGQTHSGGAGSSLQATQAAQAARQAAQSARQAAHALRDVVAAQGTRDEASQAYAAAHNAALAAGQADPSALAGKQAPQPATDLRPAQVFQVAAREAARHSDVAPKPVQRTGTELTYSFKTWNAGETARVQLTNVQAGQALSLVASSARAHHAMTEGLPALKDVFSIASVELDQQEGDEARGRRRASRDEEDQA